MFSFIGAVLDFRRLAYLQKHWQDVSGSCLSILDSHRRLCAVKKGAQAGTLRTPTLLDLRTQLDAARQACPQRCIDFGLLHGQPWPAWIRKAMANTIMQGCLTQCPEKFLDFNIVAIVAT